MEYMLTFHILNVHVDKTQPRQFKFTFKSVFEMVCLILFQTARNLALIFSKVHIVYGHSERHDMSALVNDDC